MMLLERLRALKLLLQHSLYTAFIQPEEKRGKQPSKAEDHCFCKEYGKKRRPDLEGQTGKKSSQGDEGSRNKP